MGKATMEAVEVGIGYDLRCSGCEIDKEWVLAMLLAPTRVGNMLVYVPVCEPCYDEWISQRPVELNGEPLIRLGR